MVNLSTAWIAVFGFVDAAMGCPYSHIVDAEYDRSVLPAICERPFTASR
jgi:hypothetical protein